MKEIILGNYSYYICLDSVAQQSYASISRRIVCNRIYMKEVMQNKSVLYTISRPTFQNQKS